MINLKKIILFYFLAFFSLPSLAEKKPYIDFVEYRVFFSAFNSSFILPKIAGIYGIARGKDKGLVTVGVTLNGKIGGEEVDINGNISNMLAQKQKLNFVEIKDQDAIYYIAPFEYYNEDILKFTINVKPNKGGENFPISFQKKFYYEK